MFNQLQALPADPLLGIIERYAKDANPNKIDLGVGVYKDNSGNTTVLPSVKQAERTLLETQQSKAYLGPRGDAVFAELMCSMAFGQEHVALKDQRIAALQTPGGCGALRIAAELLVETKEQVTVWVSDPTWANHIPLLASAGIEIKEYPYYDYANKTIRFDDMMAALAEAEAGDLVLLHACCHNPCGADLQPEQWQQLTEMLVEKGLIPFVDMAYQGFGESLEADAYGLRLLAERAPELVFTISCSKNFGLYRERTGIVGFIVENSTQVTPVLSHLAHIVRAIYSMPPDHGAAVVRNILSNDALRAQWVGELGVMRERIQCMRRELVEKMAARGHAGFDFVAQEKGMFSFLGVTPEQVHRLAQDHAIYMVDSSRINVAGLNEANIEYFCDSLATVLS